MRIRGRFGCIFPPYLFPIFSNDKTSPRNKQIFKTYAGINLPATRPPKLNKKSQQKIIEAGAAAAVTAEQTSQETEKPTK